MNKEWQQQAALPEVTSVVSHGDSRAGSALTMGCRPTGPEHSRQSYRLIAMSIISSQHDNQSTSSRIHPKGPIKGIKTWERDRL